MRPRDPHPRAARHRQGLALDRTCRCAPLPDLLALGQQGADRQHRAVTSSGRRRSPRRSRRSRCTRIRDMVADPFTPVAPASPAQSGATPTPEPETPILLTHPQRAGIIRAMSIYLDHAATTPLRAEALEAMLPYLSEHWGNPSSIHASGRRARQGLDEAREAVAGVLGCQPARGRLHLRRQRGRQPCAEGGCLGCQRPRAARRHLDRRAQGRPPLLRRARASRLRGDLPRRWTHTGGSTPASWPRRSPSTPPWSA